MNKRGFFIFFQWGTDVKQERMLGINLEFKCPCKHKSFNLIFNLKRGHIFWVIPVSPWEVESFYIQCPKCGRAWAIEGKEDAITDLYSESKARQELMLEGKIKPSSKSQPFSLRTIPLFAEISKGSESLEDKKRKEEMKIKEKENDKEFIFFLKIMGALAVLVILGIIIKALFF